MAQYTITLTEISAEMLDELANFAHQAWGRTDILEVEVIPGQITAAAGWTAPHITDGLPITPVAVPDPIPASPTGSIEIVLPPEEVDDFVEGPMEPAPKSARKRS